jgi:predicted glycosyltransferase involved in capsule biosynthesis
MFSPTIPSVNYRTINSSLMTPIQVNRCGTKYKIGCTYLRSRDMILVYNKEWFWETMGGYNENFFRYGWEDKATTEMIKVLLNRDDESMLRIPYEAAHLSHMSKDTRNLNLNETIFYQFTKMNQFELSNKIKENFMGKISEPTVLNL